MQASAALDPLLRATTGVAPEHAGCAHCGLPVAGARNDEGPAFCCGGCALAYRVTGSDPGETSGLLIAVGVGAFLALNVMMLSFILYSGRGEADRAANELWVRWALLLLATPALILLGLPLLNRGLQRFRHWRLDTDVLIVIGVTAAFVLSARSVLAGEGPLYLDTAMGILLFVTIGRYLEAAARARTTDALAELVQQMPSDACRISDGVEERVPVHELEVGDLVRVRPGERIPVDGVVVEGGASVSEAEITGESLPVFRDHGARVAAGTMDLDGMLVVAVARTGEQTLVARLVRLVEAARSSRTSLTPLVDRLARIFVPTVLTIAVATLVYWTRVDGFGSGVMNALTVLLIACPCAIGIAVPLAATAAVGRAAAAGVLVRSGEVFEALTRSRRVFFDKTGTLTVGRLEAVRLSPAPDISERDLLRLAAALERGSEHPVAAAVARAAAARSVSADSVVVNSFRAVPGQGVEGWVSDSLGCGLLQLGTPEFCGVTERQAEHGTSLVCISLAGEALGHIELEDQVRPSAADAVAALLDRGLEPEVLSGDSTTAVQALTTSVPGLRAHGRLEPEQKLDYVRRSIADGESPLMVGDGINDAPALSGAAVGVTLESGTDLAREVADVTILGADLHRLPWVIDLARATMRTAKANLFWAFFYNGIGLSLAVRGVLHPLHGAAAMVASGLLVVLHSQRLTRFPLPDSRSS